MEGEWNSFNAVYVNEEADFMAQLFPSSNNNVELSYNAELGSYYPTDSTSNNPQSLYYHSQESSYCNLLNDHHHHQASASNASSSLPIDFLACHQVEGDDDGLNIEITMDPVPDQDKNSDSSESDIKKRLRVSDVPRGKRNVRGKRSQKRAFQGNDEEDEEEGEENQSIITEGTATASISKGKTKASRGSATDPQSLYARKRRERINERLRILQSLVPNGTKVDISTMLEEAVQYVKFLQLQIKLLSSDDLWMYAPIAYNGMNIGLDFKINIPK